MRSLRKRLESQTKASKSTQVASKRSTPSHVLAVLNKAVVEPVVASEEPSEKQKGIRKEFLGKNALPTDVDRNLVSVELKDNLQLYHTFDTGEQIITDLSKIQGTVENYVHLSTTSGTGSSVNSRSLSVDTLADTPLIVQHDLNLTDPEAIMISAYLNGRLVDLDIQIMDSNSIEILTYVDTVGLKLNFLGL